MNCVPSWWQMVLCRDTLISKLADLFIFLAVSIGSGWIDGLLVAIFTRLHKDFYTGLQLSLRVTNNCVLYMYTECPRRRCYCWTAGPWWCSIVQSSEESRCTAGKLSWTGLLWRRLYPVCNRLVVLRLPFYLIYPICWMTTTMLMHLAAQNLWLPY